MKSIFFILLFMSILFTFGCEEEESVDDNFKIEEIRGFVQKGPFLNGTTLIISELDPELIPTGKNYTSQLLDNMGSFELKGMDLSSQFVEVMATGFYFNEVKNLNSESQLTLYALADLKDNKSLNVNIISNLERTRVNFLLDSGMDFNEAKKQAQKEIMAIFEIVKPDIIESEKLDITRLGDDNAILLAISVILQGDLPVADLSELLANIATDLRSDGILDSETIGTFLINNARLLQLDQVRDNLENRCELLGLDTDIPEFEKYVNHFIENTSYEFTLAIDYPETGIFGENLISLESIEIPQGRYSLSAVLPERTSLVVKMEGKGFYINNNPYDISNYGWEVLDQRGVFASAQTGKIDLEILAEGFVQDTMLMATGSMNSFRLEVYENGSTSPQFFREFSILPGK
jgi:hypothetical protein